MGKGLAITGFILSLISLILFFLAKSMRLDLVLGSNLIVWIILLVAVFGFFISLIVLIKKLEGKGFAIVGIILDILIGVLSYIALTSI